MKSVLMLFSCLFVANFTNAQKLSSLASTVDADVKNKFAANYKSTKKTGWILFGVGLAMMCTGTYLYLVEELQSDTHSQTEAGPVLFYTGAATTLVGVSFLISAGNSKKKARIAFKQETLRIKNMVVKNSGYSAVALTLQL